MALHAGVVQLTPDYLSASASIACDMDDIRAVLRQLPTREVVHTDNLPRREDSYGTWEERHPTDLEDHYGCFVEGEYKHIPCTHLGPKYRMDTSYVRWPRPPSILR
jgi:hypothetical protein